MKWDIPPTPKVYEALGTIADGRLEIDGNNAKVYSSSGNKHYTITYWPDKNMISCNDNASYYVGYLGYPTIAFLMKIGKLPFNEKFSIVLKGIPWKKLNQKNKNDFDKTIEELKELIEKRGANFSEMKKFGEKVIEEIKKAGFEKPEKMETPPKGY